MNSLVVQTLVAGTEAVALDRWFGAVVEALEESALSRPLRWRVVVAEASGTVGETVSAPTALRLGELARAAGGSFAVAVATPGHDVLDAHRRLAEDADEDFALLVDANAIMLSSTFERLLEAISDGAPVRAREIPLEHPEEGATACALWTLAQLRDSARGVVTTVECPEAVAFRDRRIPARRGVHREASAAMGSLLEEASSRVPAAGEEVARVLSTREPALMSIVMRTQAQRGEALRDALLCLAGQCDARFEVLLVVHDGDSAAVEQIVADQPAWLRHRASVLPADGGTRSRPLNVGLAAARGSIVCFLDDDDLVFGHWVESVLEGAQRHPRRLLRSVAGVQSVTTTQWRGGIEGHATRSDVSLPYPELFNLADHLRVNMTPFMTLAFPRPFFEVYGGADEQLEVCEDWDLVLRGAISLGVSDLDEVTAIYRRWTSGRDSYTVHQVEVWERDMQRVRAKCDASPLLLPAGSASELAALSLLRA
ncbi:MAG: glycosyltransferase family 2 protein, partial [Demequinaceae bacterium]|nr:glycosyltransferase family 2 protein [Demequinaceae bacterium]